MHAIGSLIHLVFNSRSLQIKQTRYSSIIAASALSLSSLSSFSPRKIISKGLLTYTRTTPHRIGFSAPMSSPFSTRCPSELLVKCFQFCVYPDVPDMEPGSAPILLTYVCRRWREVVLETPLLWSRLRLDQLFPPEFPLFGCYLQRSKGMPLTCSLRDSLQAGAGHYDPFFLRLLEEADRWYDIALGGSYRQSDVRVVAPELAFPRLQRLQIMDWPSDASISLRSIFKNSPNLRRVALKVPYICDCLKLMPFLS